MNFKQLFVFTTACLIAFSHILFAQGDYKVTDSKDNDMKLLGTSTLHKWTMDAKTFTGEAQFDLKDDKLAAANALAFSLPVENLKSDEKALNKNAYKALKTDKFKNITFKLTSATVSPGSDGKYLVKAKGNLTIAGVTKAITMDLNCLVNKDGSVTCSGSYKLNMTDYLVKPPTFMMGAMKTGDAVTLDFTLVYTK